MLFSPSSDVKGTLPSSLIPAPDRLPPPLQVSIQRKVAKPLDTRASGVSTNPRIRDEPGPPTPDSPSLSLLLLRAKPTARWENTVTVSFVQHTPGPSSASEHFGKIHSHGSRASLLGGSFDPSFRHPAGFRAREGYTNVAPAAAPSRVYWPNTQWTWSFAIITFVQTLVTLGLEWYVARGWTVESSDADSHDDLVIFSQISRSKRSQTKVPRPRRFRLSSLSTASVSSTSWCWYTMRSG